MLAGREFKIPPDADRETLKLMVRFIKPAITGWEGQQEKKVKRSRTPLGELEALLSLFVWFGYVFVFTAGFRRNMFFFLWL